MFSEEASPCPLDDVYEVLVIICWLPQGVVHPNSAFIDLDNKKDPVESVSYTYMYKKCLIYIYIHTYIYSQVKKKYKELTRSCTETECIDMYFAYARP
jgi:hypothetical protein